MASNSVFAELLKSSNKLDGSNFTVWKRKIMFLLTAENIEYVVMTSAPTKPAADASDDEKGNYAEELGAWTKDNKKARIFILGSMTDSLAGEYESETSASKIFRGLEQDFGEVSLIKVLSLLNRFLSSKMGENTSINEHLNKLSVLVEDLKNAGHPFTEQVQVMVALNSLPSSWERFKISFCHMERTLNLRTLRHHLLMKEDRKLSQGKERSSYPAELHLGSINIRGIKGIFRRRNLGSIQGIGLIKGRIGMICIALAERNDVTDLIAITIIKIRSLIRRIIDATAVENMVTSRQIATKEGS
uniref:Uncharacterized protein n=1 Tax=Avena sativa TaxID=4498 RepID=A0ACD5UQQ7_AVESA